MKAHPYYTLLILAAMLGSSVSQADEIKPQTQRNSRKPVTTPAAAARKLVPESAAKKTSQNPDTQTNSQTQLRSEVGKLEQDEVKDALDDLRVRPEVADKIVKEVADPATSTPAKGRIAEIAGAAADLDLVAVNPKVRDAVVDAVSRSDNPKETADKEVGKAAIDEVFGKEVTKLVPAGKLGRTVFTSLIGISGALQNLGADADDPEVIDAVKEGAKLGVATPEAARIVMEKGAQKVLDKQGFTPAKPGESLNDRLGREAEEQKKLQAELDAKKAADAARAASKARSAAAQQAAKARAGNIGSEAISQGAAGSTHAGRSVSSKVKVAVGGGTGSSSGAGTARTGTGTDASKSTGVGGNARMDNASIRLAAGDGGVSNAGQAATGNDPTANPDNNPTPPGASRPPGDDLAPGDHIDSKHAPQSPILADADVNTPATTQPETSATPNNPHTGGGNSGSQVTGGDDVLIGMNGPHVSMGTEQYQTGDNSRTSTTYFADGTFEETTITVTRDSSGRITSTTETNSTGTWAPDSHGNKKQTSSTTSNSTTTASNGQSTSTDNQNNSEEEDDDDDDDKKSEDPPPAEEAASDDTEAETTTEESKEASTTPNPMDIGGGDPSQLAARTGGRIGNQEARRQQRGLDLARFGGAAGPNPEGKGGVPTLLTPEEKANAERALSMRKGAGVTNPNPLGKGSVVATDRDLKEMHLRGNGGAKGPTDKTAPAKPQDPRSPVGGSTPGLAPTGGTRINASKSKAATVNRNLSGDRRIAEDALKSNIRN